MRLGKEALKSYVLILLLITSVLQVGILWMRQNYGLPFNFLSEVFSSQKTDFTADGSEYFKPSKIVVSGGDESHWIMNQGSNRYALLWKEIESNYIKSIFQNNLQPASSVPYSEEEWGKQVIKNAVVADFKTNIPTPLLSWFYKISAPPFDEPAGIHKLAVLPREDVNNGITLYITDDSKIYKYIFPVQLGWITRDGYKKIFEDIRQDESLRKYMVIAESDYRNKGKSPIAQDILMFAGASLSSYEGIRSVYCEAPEAFTVKDRKNPSELENLSSLITAGEKEVYDWAEDVYGATVFKNLNNLYKVYGDGLLEYKYIGTPDDSEKSSVGSAFEKAVEFIGKRKNLFSGANLYFSGIQTVEKGVYEITFDYWVDSVPVFVDYKSNDRDGVQLSHAVTIRANSKRVTSAWWIIKRFEQGKEDKYNINFADFLDNTFTDYSKLKNDKDFFISDISISYSIQPYLEKQSMEPVWVVSAKGQKNYVYPMQKREGG
ncbi:MAG: hypothetical protein QHH06_04420 [Clostridiales bacterium]|jgi:hypothetical protein|nr:hypothetical protein [Eubacteriales bacterium]MDH7565712.1 hypothetical protein [Clostridiales bacterium]